MKPVRVLVIDDSLTMRRLIRLALTADPRIEVVGEACNGLQARQKIAELRPEVLTLDVEMPDESGLAFLARLMAARPMPVVMVSAETHAGSAAAIEALSLGAVECIGKPAFADKAETFAMLPDIVVAAATARVRPRAARPAPAPAGRVPKGAQDFAWNGRYVLIGASTGGVDALQQILASFPANCPPTVIAQHMPGAFLASLVQRLNRTLAPEITLARDGARLRPGQVHIAPGGEAHLTISGGKPACRLEAGDRRNCHRPSVDVLFESAVPLRRRAIGVILTGMGRDGAAGLLKMRQAGAICLAQDRDSSVVWGMPGSAVEMGAAERVLPLCELGPEILKSASRSAVPA
ncbi:chemotaxis response regulator protein-glutamate methylesterase [Paracoccus sp. Z118]|uniref:protein-glutamate methylesterase/protein-glutamine glutaminase n=1 Tax=Paracoccus sp. Z118 TaxID=2851017 RepID=UPI001C2C0D58|nr:chemotaxis response regulator protein-glutamate methylesterase [Paracoccus sp. Z118]MBV0890366.1 chemotaxis response regulator protein-glutamate methylesterase [Paracoccus sp. Z118]